MYNYAFRKVRVLTFLQFSLTSCALIQWSAQGCEATKIFIRETILY